MICRQYVRHRSVQKKRLFDFCLLGTVPLTREVVIYYCTNGEEHFSLSRELRPCLVLELLFGTGANWNGISKKGGEKTENFFFFDN